jgi:hypothetical protein
MHRPGGTAQRHSTLRQDHRPADEVLAPVRTEFFAATRDLQAHGYGLVAQIISRAQAAGVLRADVTVEDMAFVVLGSSATIEATAAIAPELWRRHLGLLLDGFRAAAAHPLPVPPLAAGRAHRAAGWAHPADDARPAGSGAGGSEAGSGAGG